MHHVNYSFFLDYQKTPIRKTHNMSIVPTGELRDADGTVQPSETEDCKRDTQFSGLGEKPFIEADVEGQRLGPIVINEDGSLSRIKNWPSMTPEEQAQTKRVILARNERRRARLIAEEKEEKEKKAKEEEEEGLGE